MSHILGLSAYYHDSAAALVSDGKIIAAAQEERFTRKKHDAGFPTQAIRYCLAEAGLAFNAIDQVVFYDKPLVKFERLLETYIATTPRGFPSFLAAMPIWLKEKLYLKTVIRRELAAIGECEKKALPSLLFAEHHQSHAASAFFPSPFPEAAVLCMDGVGEWATTTVWHGKDNRVHPLWQIDFPHSLGLLYSAFTYFTGFKVNSGEYKLMGLAPYGVPRYTELILDNLIDVKLDGTFRLAMEYFDYATGLRMTNDRFSELFRRGPRAPESPLTQDEMDIAASIQVVTEDIVLRLAQTIHAETGLKNLCLAGGVALNCVANGRLLREGPFEGLWIQPAAGDAGGALGCALATWHEYLDQPRSCDTQDAMQGAYLGPAFTDAEARESLESVGAVYNTLEASELYSSVAELLAKGNVVGWFQGRMEFGPRALGARSIIGDPRNIEMQSVMNLKIKYRESFRPFAPAVLAERIADYFEQAEDSPYMLLVANVREMLRKQVSVEDDQLFGIDKLNVLRSELPAITHIDYSARIQSVHKETNPQFHALLSAFDQLTGCGVLVNTSFNVRGEPIVCTPLDAYRCFMRTEMDSLVIGNMVFAKMDQPVWNEEEDWRETFELD
ncbi:MAG: carbamoyltransferase [Gammaproteobacteria bacterium]|nr:carbamoyltransferase [Gammaproteobacteria bacterium]